jgi:hypothetical protein
MYVSYTGLYETAGEETNVHGVNFVTKSTLIMITLGEIFADQLSLVFSVERNPDGHRFKGDRTDR